MLRMLSKDRNELMQDRHYDRYLFYAFGEIVLVVIGILIALQIDTWNKDREERKEELYLLNSFLADINRDIEELDFIIAQTIARQKQVDSIFIILQDPQAYTVQDFLKFQIPLMIDDYFTADMGTFDESKSSGKISYVLNNDLREQIFDYYNRSSAEWNNDQANYKTTNDRIIPIMIDEFGASSEMVQLISGHTAEHLPDINLSQIANNQRYYQALLYSTGDQYQLRDWQTIQKLAKNLKENLKAELAASLN